MVSKTAGGTTLLNSEQNENPSEIRKEDLSGKGHLCLKDYHVNDNKSGKSPRSQRILLWTCNPTLIT